MSRQVDTEDLTVLSEADLDYLATRGQPHVEREVNAERARRAKEARQQPVVEEVDEPYSKWKVDDLRDECKARGLPTDGKKEDLAARLEADDAQDA
jgi:hypothetical protein